MHAMSRNDIPATMPATLAHSVSLFSSLPRDSTVM